MATQNIFSIQDDIVGEIVDALVGNGTIMAEEVQEFNEKVQVISVCMSVETLPITYKTNLPDDYEKINGAFENR